MPSLPKLSTLNPSLEDLVVGVGELGGELRSMREAVATAAGTGVAVGVTTLLLKPNGPAGLVESDFWPRLVNRFDSSSPGLEGCFTLDLECFRRVFPEVLVAATLGGGGLGGGTFFLKF